MTTARTAGITIDFITHSCARLKPRAPYVLWKFSKVRNRQLQQQRARPETRRDERIGREPRLLRAVSLDLDSPGGSLIDVLDGVENRRLVAGRIEPSARRFDC